MKPEEKPAVKTTIVGGRPPGSGRGWDSTPHGIELLVKKAAVDEQFRAKLLEQRGMAAAQLELVLSPAETAMLASVPQAQLEAMIAASPVRPAERPAYLGRTAAVILAALTAGTAAFDCAPRPAVTGSRPETPQVQQTNQNPPADQDQYKEKVSRGIRPDHPDRDMNRPSQP
jgi:hypothetical protein